MDLIYMNANREDVGVLMDYELDLAFGADENNFECRTQAKSHCCEAGYYLYSEGTEYGGIVDNIESDTAAGDVVYSGRTWHGILNSKVIEPDADKSHLILSGEANSVLGSLISRLNLSSLFTASVEDSGITINGYKMSRYIPGYDGIAKMLAAIGAKLRVTFRGGMVVLSAVARHDYSRDEEFDSDQLEMRIKRYHKPVNHLICLGGGEMTDRLVVHLYADEDGNISRTQMQTGLDEVSTTYDCSAITDEAELVAEGTDKLRDLLASDEVSVDFDADSDAYDVGDIVGAYDNITGLYISTEIKKKIVTIKNGKVTISLTPGTAKTNATKGTGGGGTGGSLDLDKVYPVGALFLSTNPTSPATMFGGTWERIEDVFLLAAGTAYAPGTTGGESTHTLTENELPNVSGAAEFRGWGSGASITDTSGVFERGTSDTNEALPFATGSPAQPTRTLTMTFGGNQPHNNMPPYFAIYVWQRTA